MGTRVLCLLTIILGMAVQMFAASPTQPVIVARFNRRHVTQSIPQTTMYTPSHTGLFRVSAYMTVTSPSGVDDTWNLNLTWADDAGTEVQCVAALDSSHGPPNSVPLNCVDINILASPFVFEGVAGKPMAFSLNAPNHNPPGAISIAVIVEKLE